MYYAGLPEAQIAAAMRISHGAVKNHTTQAMSSLRAELRRRPLSASDEYVGRVPSYPVWRTHR
jgi:DNA-directed RNA polymerase specialized sigma24 family protein